MFTASLNVSFRLPYGGMLGLVYVGKTLDGGDLLEAGRVIGSGGFTSRGGRSIP